MSLAPSDTTTSLAEKREKAAALLRQRLAQRRRRRLSFAQQRLWFLDQLDPGSATYNVPSAVRLDGPVDFRLLARSLTAIAARHDVLRTRADVDAGHPVQEVGPKSPVALPIVDLRALPRARDTVLRRLADAEAARPFDLSRAPLFRARIIRAHDDSCVLLVTLHHFICDGWSVGPLVHEFLECYGAAIEGRAPVLPSLSVQYADFADWQRERLTGRRRDDLLDYWRNRLAHLPALSLPSDRPRPPVESHRGATWPFELRPDVVAALAAHCREARASLFMGLFAAFHTVLAEFTQQHDFALGTVIAGRTRAELEPLIGCFINTLVIRAAHDRRFSFRDLLTQVRETTLEAYAHQELPFERLVEELAPDRDLHRHPLVNVMISLQDAAQAPIERGGLHITPVPIAQHTAKCDLFLTCRQTADALFGTIDYAIDLFDAPTIDRLARQFAWSLERMVEEPDRPLSELSCVADEEREWLLRAGRGPAMAVSGSCAHERVAARATLAPDAIAIVAGADHVSCAALQRRALALAHRLRALGVGPDATVAVSLDRSVDMVAALLGVLHAGAAYVPLDPGYPHERLAFMLADSRAAALVTRGSVPDRFSTWRGPALDVDDEDPHAAARTPLPVAASTRHAAYVIYTSGSTGWPKGTVIEHGALANALEGMALDLGVGQADRLLAVTTLSFDIAALELFMPLMAGATTVIATSGTASSSAELIDLLAREAITVMQATPTTWRLLVDDGWTGSPRLRALCGGEALPAALAVRLRERCASVTNMYGPTETTIWSTLWPLTAAPIAIGQPIANTLVYVLDRHDRLAPIGAPGEICIGGNGLARGYLRRAALTAARFVPDPCGVPGARIYRTGDRGRWRADGQLEYLGRLDAQVKLRGHRVELGEIEAAMDALPRVRQSAAAVRDDEAHGERLVGYVVMEPESDRADALNVAALRAHLDCRLPAFMVPQVFVPLAQLPLTPAGKVDRAALPPPPRDAEPSAVVDSLRTPSEEILTGIWATVLHRDRIGRHDDFFALGGHSLLATQVVARVRTTFAVELPLRALFEAPTIARLAARVDEARATEPAAAHALVPVPRGGPLPLSFAQQRLWFLDQLAPDSRAHTLPYAVRLAGRLDVSALARAVTGIVARHEVLRTRFPAPDGRPAQEIVPAAVVPIATIDLDALGARAEATAHRLARDQALRPFDLAQGPLLRAALLRLAPDAHVLLVLVHHIASDAWSLGLLVHEFVELYAAAVERRAPVLPPLRVQYADFAQWQRERLHDAVLERQVGYWRQQLAGVPPLELPTDYPRPAVQSHRGAVLPVALSAELTHGLRQVSQGAHVTLFMTLLAAYQVLLARVSGQRDFAIGTAIAGRTHTDLEPLIGFFINTLALRTSLAGNPSFGELLRRVRDTTLNAYANQDVSFERLVEELAPDRDLARAPVHQVALVFQNVPGETLQLPGLSLAPFSLAFQTARRDLRLELVETPDGVTGWLEYAADLFRAETVEHLLACFVALLERLVEDPEAPVFAVPLAPPAEQATLRRWTVAEQMPVAADIVAQVEAQVARQPDAIAAVDDTRQLSYAALDARANQLAHALRELGVEPDVCVAVCLPRGITLGVAWLGVLKAGAAYIPLDATYPVDRLAHMLETTRVPVVLADASSAARLPWHWGTVLTLDEDADLWTAPSPASALVDVPPAALAYVIFTSGSTGRPKGVAVTRGGMSHLATAQQHVFGSTADVVLQFASASFDASVWEWLLAWPRGGRLVFAEPEHLDAVTARERITMLTAPPSVLAPSAPAALRSVERLVLAGEACSGEVLARWSSPRRAIYDAYGPTETAVCATISAPLAATPDIGRALPHARVYVVEPSVVLAPIGVAGELWVGGAGVARGYVGQPALTAARFVADPFSGDSGARLYRTGDRVRWRADGVLEYLGRVDEQVKLRGHRIEPGEIEAVLAAHPGVRQCAVALAEDAPGESRLVAYIARDPAHTDDALAALSRQHLSQRQDDFDDLYRETWLADPDDPTFDITGWKSAGTGEPFAADDMRQQVEETAQRIAACRPRHVLDVGCGAGLLLFRVAPGCASYWAADFSRRALDRVSARIDRLAPAFAHVKLLHRAADDFEGLPDASFDLIILSSVIQYFPSAEYLTNTLERAMRVLAPGGTIFVGDVRDLGLLHAFHAARHLDAADDRLGTRELARTVARHVADESELVVAPDWFHAFAESHPDVPHVTVLPKRGCRRNELTRYRYDVVLEARRPGPRRSPAVRVDWLRDDVTLDSLRGRLSRGRPESVLVTGVPNARVMDAVRASGLLEDPGGPASAPTIADLRAQVRMANVVSAGDPEDIWTLGDDVGYAVTLMLPEDGEAGACDALFVRRDAPGFVDVRSHAVVERRRGRTMEMTVNQPLRRLLAGELVPQLRKVLREQLPEYMMPGAFVLLERLPLLPSGKLDRRTLARLAAEPVSGTSGPVAPRTAVEKTLAEIWREVLHRDTVGVHDSFFDLGGYSLVATQVTSRVRSLLDVQLPIRALFETPTIAGLARQIARLQQGQTSDTPPPIRRAPRDRPLPLSFAQQRLWFLDQLNPGSVEYTCPEALRLDGVLDLRALIRSLNGIVERHEILRTTFPLVDAAPVQQIGPSTPLRVPLVDLSALPASGREPVAKRLVAADAARPFNLSLGPLLRTMVVRVDRRRHVLSLNVHHIVSDGWSVAVFARELAAHYRAYVNAAVPQLPDLPIQYADVAVWQRDWLRGAVLEKQLAYWRGPLVDAPPALPIATDFARDGRRAAGADEEFAADERGTAALQELARRVNATPFMVYVAALGIAMHHWTNGHTDVVIGIDVANRTDVHSEGLIGFFVNVLPLRLDLEGNPAFEPLLARVRNVTMGAYAHQDLPYEKLVEELRPERTAGRASLFETVLVFQNTPAEALRLPGIDVSRFVNQPQHGKFDLIWNIAESASGLGGCLRYNGALFTAQTARRMTRHFVALLSQVAANPECRLAECRERLAELDAEYFAERARQEQGELLRGLRAARRQPLAASEPV